MLVEPWLERAAARRPDHPALQTSAGVLGYRALLDRARRAAGALQAAGAGPGDRVALELPWGEDFVVALHGCLLAGAVAVPVDRRLAGPERRRIASGCRHAVAEPLDGPPAPPRPHDLDAPAVVVHTSGSTGAPKPVELTYGNWLWNALGSATALGHPSAERWLCTLPLSHVGGLSILLRSAIAGTTVVLHERFDADRAIGALEDATIVSVVPTTLARLLDAGLRYPPRLRWALLGGAPIAPLLLERAQAAGVPVAPTYGLTEACSQVTTHGWPLFCTRVRVDDRGEVLVRGPTVAPGALRGDGWLATGDLGRVEADGRLAIVGRRGDTIVTGGENVAPAEVEAVLETHPAVAEAAVHARPHPEWGEAVVATVVLRPGADLAPGELREHAGRSLAAFKVPKEVRIAERLPRTASGKLRRDELR